MTQQRITIQVAMNAIAAALECDLSWTESRFGALKLRHQRGRSLTLEDSVTSWHELTERGARKFGVAQPAYLIEVAGTKVVLILHTVEWIENGAKKSGLDCTTVGLLREKQGPDPDLQDLHPDSSGWYGSQTRRIVPDEVSAEWDKGLPEEPNM